MERRVSTYTGITGDNPVPRTSRKGPLIFSSMITGRDPASGRMPDGIEAQARHLFGHIRALVVGAGGTTDDIVKVDLWMVDRRDRAALDAEWVAMFPDKMSRPARHTRQAELEDGQLIVATFIAVVT